jgi:putative FmdB family regulatory protein
MPTYRYRCSACGDDFEVWQSINDDRLTAHEGTCGGALTRVLSPAGIVLKGSGFYKTDNRSKNGSAATRDGAKSDTKSEKSEKSEKSDKSEKKSDAKPTSGSADSSTKAAASA